MGSAISRPRGTQREIDGGPTMLAQTPPEGGSRGTRHGPAYDARVVRRYIQDRRLAPFYEGLASPAVPEGAEQRVAEVASADTLATVAPAQSGGFRQRRRQRKEEKALRERTRLEALLAVRRTECPICFLVFPANINRTTCCRQPLCTQCFVRIRRPPSGRVITCPFCNSRDLAVAYAAPKAVVRALGEHLALAGATDNPGASTASLASTQARLAQGAKHARPVRCEAVKPFIVPVQPRPVSHRHGGTYAAYAGTYAGTRTHARAAGRTRHNAQGAPTGRFVPYTGPAFTVRHGGRTTTYGRGTMVMYTDYGAPIFLPPDSYVPRRVPASRFPDYTQDFHR